MSNWKNGIPDYSLTNYFVYFQDLLKPGISPNADVRKQALAGAAIEDFNSGQESLNNLLKEGEELEKIGKLIKAVA